MQTYTPLVVWSKMGQNKTFNFIFIFKSKILPKYLKRRKKEVFLIIFLQKSVFRFFYSKKPRSHSTTSSNRTLWAKNCFKTVSELWHCNLRKKTWLHDILGTVKAAYCDHFGLYQKLEHWMNDNNGWWNLFNNIC